MTWGLILALAAIAYGFKVLGLVVIGARKLPAALDRCLVLVPAALLAALIASDTFGSDGGLSVDARAAGVAVAGLAAWRRAPFVVIVVAGTATAAIIRHFS